MNSLTTRRMDPYPVQGSWTPPPPEPPEKALFQLEPIRALKKYWKLVVVITLVVACLATAGLIFLPRSYHAETLVYIPPPAAGGSDSYTQQIQTDISTVLRRSTLERVLQDPAGSKWREKGESQASALLRLQKSLQVAREDQSYQISIGIFAGDPAFAAAMTDAVAKSFLTQAQLDDTGAQSERSVAVLRQADEAERELAAMQTEQAELTRKLGLSSAGVNSMMGDPQISEQWKSLATARMQHDDATARLDAFERDGGASNADVDDAITADAGFLTARNGIMERRSTLQQQMTTVTSQHPLYKQSSEEIAKLDTQLAQMTSDARKRAVDRVRRKLRQEVERTRAVESRQTGDVNSLQMQTASQTPALQRLQFVNAETMRLRQAIAKAHEEARGTDPAQSSVLGMRIAVPADPNTLPEAGKQRLALKALIPLSFFFGWLVAIVLSLMEKTVARTADIEKLLGFPAIASLPKSDEVSTDVMRSHFLRLASGIERIYQAVDDGSGNGRTIVVTGADAGAGVTTILHEVCVILAGLGHSVLLADASGKSESLVFTPTTKSGESMDPEDTALMLPSDTSSFAPDDAYVRARWALDIVKDLKARYDIILFDSAPLTSSAEAEYLSRMADATVLVARADQTPKRSLHRAAQVLEQIGVDSIAVVLNCVRLDEMDKDRRRELAEMEARMSKDHARRARRGNVPPQQGTRPESRAERGDTVSAD